MKIIIRCALGIVLSFAGFYTMTAAAVEPETSSSAQCPEVDCNCEVVPKGKWQELCLFREKQITEECLVNGGRPKSYCGLHGPDAYPVATSIQFKKRPQVDLDLKTDSLSEIIETQTWSLMDDFKVLSTKEAAGDVGEAIQVFGIYRRNSERLFELQQQVVLGLLAKEQPDIAANSAVGFTTTITAMIDKLSAYADVVWRKSGSAAQGQQKYYRSLAFKLSREVATELERVAELYSYDPEGQVNAAMFWQRAAHETQKTLEWEQSTTNKSKYVAFYQQQVTARLNRATLYWLMGNSAEQVAKNIESVRESLSADEERLIDGNGAKDLAVNIKE